MTMIKLNISFTFIVLSIISLMHIPAFAAEQVSAASAVPFPSGQATPQIGLNKERDGRLQYAKALLSFIKKIDDQIPSLSPSQREWLDKEMSEYRKTRNLIRYNEISNTKEYNMDLAKSGLAGIIKNLNSIINDPSSKKEIYLWSLIADDLMNIGFWSCINILIEDFKIVDIKLFNLDSTEKIDQDHFYISNGMVPSWQILRNVIEPYLNQ